MVKIAEKMENSMREIPENAISIFTVFYWRNKFLEIRKNLPRTNGGKHKAIINFLIEVDKTKYDCKKWVNHAKNVTTGNAGLEVTKEVCEVLEEYLKGSGQLKAQKSIPKLLTKQKILTQTV